MSPLSWAAVNASASGIAMSKNVSSGMPPGGISFVSVFPSTRVMVRKWTPSSSSTESSDDVRVVECRERPCFLLQTDEAGRVRSGVRGQDLQGDHPTELRVLRPIDLAHAARAEPRHDAIVQQLMTRLERHDNLEAQSLLH